VAVADVGIAGAGLAGPLLAVFLARRGHDVTLYERRPDPRLVGTGGRSINLALSARGLDALERVGLADDVLAKGLAMRGRMVHDRTGQLAFQPYSADGSKAINSISRHTLNVVLLDAAAKEPGVIMHFGERAAGVVADTGEIGLDGPAGRHSVGHEVVIGADGAYSALREAVVHSERADYHQEHLPWGYKELTIAPDQSGEFVLDPGALHIWPRGDSMMIALPNPDRSFTATLFWPFTGPVGFAGLDSAAAIRARFDQDYPDATERFEDLAGEFVRNPVGALVTVRVWPWVRGRLALLGDAAHAIVPFFGQGMNCAFEDVVELDRCLDEAADDWTTALSTYAERRKPNTDAIADLALANFVEMRDKVASRAFRLRKRAEHAVERWAPDRFESLYELVSFTTVPYAEARRRAAAQRRFPANVAAVATAGVARIADVVHKTVGR
jgi:kynurenine 3-monooxygenase